MHSRIAGALCSIALAAASAAETPVEESAPVIAVVDAFHDALRRGDGKAVMELLAPDAMILESGSSETRSEYEQHHLKEDIAFAREVQSTHSLLSVRLEGKTAWVISTSRTKGSFRGRQINSIGTELMVLTKSLQGWQIRAIHWSSHEAKDAPAGASY
jgi:ketosteroid isomerase-like protein